MTDQERYKEWLRAKSSDDMNYMSIESAFLAALAIGREEGRKERTVEIHREIDKRYYAIGDFVKRRYPEYFECGCHQLGEVKCSSCNSSVPLPECFEEGEKR